MTTLLAVLGFGALFVIFGMFYSSRAGCSGCSCADGTCRKHGPDAKDGGGS